MKVHEMCLAGLLALALLGSACTGSSEGVVAAPTADPDQTNVPEASAVQTPAATPTTDPAASMTDEQRIDAAMAQFEVDVAAGEVDSVFAYDVLETKISDDGNVTLTVCAWAGDTVFDQVRDSLYRTRVEPDATVTATRITTSVAGGDCINTQLIESALDHINAYDEFARSFAAEPASFADDPRQELVTDQVAENLGATVAQFIDDDVYFIGSRVPGDVQDSAVADLLWRRYRTEGLLLLEIVVCRDMDPERGMYRDGALIDDGKSGTASGPHSIDMFQLQPNPDEFGKWLVAGRQALIWSNCFAGDSWPEAASTWQPQATQLEVLDL